MAASSFTQEGCRLLGAVYLKEAGGWRHLMRLIYVTLYPTAIGQLAPGGTRPAQEATMHHPTQYETMAKIKQAELLREAVEGRAAQDLRANTPQPAAHGLVVALALGALAIGLLLLPILFWAG